MATLILFPYIRAKVLMQANKKKQVAAAGLEQGQETCAEPKKDTIASTLQRVYTEEGPLALYRGLGPELTRVRLLCLMGVACAGSGADACFLCVLHAGSAVVRADAHDQGEDPNVHHTGDDDR
jgi:hypothetical protein